MNYYILIYIALGTLFPIMLYKLIVLNKKTDKECNQYDELTKDSNKSKNDSKNNERI